nr:response regulator [Polymorphobacter sp.]
MTNVSQGPSKAIVPRRVLIVEDEILIAMVLEDVLEMLGHTVVGSPSTYAEAESAIAAGGFDLAILDVNLGNDPVFPLADKLRCAGTAIIFATGSHPDSLPVQFAGVPVLEKPYAVQAVETALGELA